MMKKLLISAVAAASLISLVATDVAASDRYRKVAPVIVGDSLTAPWVNQLGARQRVVARVSTGGAFTSTRRVVRYTQPQVQQAAVAPRATKQQPVQRQMNPRFLPQIVDYQTSQPAGSIVIDTNERFLYLVLGNGKARRYGVGVGKPGFEWAGAHKISSKKEWPSWTPPKEMIAREAVKGHYLPDHMEGGPANPLGARALYLGSTLYRIHGTNAPWTIGYAVSSGCIRMRNEDVVDLYERVKVGTKVTVI